MISLPFQWKRWSRSQLVRGGAIALLAILVYLPAFRAGFIWDDDRYVTANPLVTAPDGLHRLWFSADPMDYYPLTNTSFWMEWRLWGLHAEGYHTTNILLHACNAVLLWVLLRRLGIPGAWLGAVLFAVHPLNVETVAWISQRKNLLAMLFFLMSALAFVRYDQRSTFRDYAAALALFALSLLCKPVVIAFPAVLLAYAWWRNARLTRVDCLRSIPFFAVAGIYALITVAFQYGKSLEGEHVGAETLAGQVILACRAVWFYVFKALMPFRLCHIYPQWQAHPHRAADYLPALLLVAAVAALWRCRAAWRRAALFAAAYTVFLLLPVLGFFQVGYMFYAMVADHWVYAALPGILAPAGSAIIRASHSATPWLRRTTVTLASLGVLLLCALSFQQSRLYRDSRTLFLDTVQRNPQAWVAHVLLGNIAIAEGRLDQAESRYRTALRIKPDYWEADHGLGAVLAMRGELDEAIVRFRRVLAAKPQHAGARRNLAIALADQARRAATAAPPAPDETLVSPGPE